MLLFSRRQPDVDSQKNGLVMKVRELISSFRTGPKEIFSFALNKRMNERNTGVVPSRIAVLITLGLDDEIAVVLREQVRNGADESAAVFALLLLLAELNQLDELSPANLKIVLALKQKVPVELLSVLHAQLLPVVNSVE
jgi:hypothetical protein